MAEPTKKDIRRERAARAVMTASGFIHTGPGWLINIKNNPRVAAWVRTADLVLASSRSRERLGDFDG